MEQCYAKGETDEFLKPGIFAYGNEQRVRDNDVVFFFNFRADRARQMSDAFLYSDFDGFDREVQPKVHYVTLTEYDAKYPSPIVFEQEQLDKSFLAQIVSEAGRPAPLARTGKIRPRHFLLQRRRGDAVPR